MSNILNRDFLIEVAANKVDNYSIMEAFGERENVGTTTAGEDITRMNDLTPAPASHTTIPTPAAAGEQMTIISESALDGTSLNTGIQEVEIHYLDADGNPQTELKTMNGTTGVNTTATNIRFIQYMHATVVGTGGVAAGHIKIYKTGTVNLVYCMIAQGGNMSLLPHRMVPLGKKLILLGWHASEATGKRQAIRIRSTDNEGVILTGIFNFKDTFYLNKTVGVNNFLHQALPALAIVKVSSWANVTGGEVACGWNGLLLPE